MVTRLQIVEYARTFLGVPFHHQGRTRAGLDCAGVVVRIAHDLGLSGADLSGYSRIPDGRALQDLLEREAVRVPAPQPGDIALMRFQSDPQHLGILTDHGLLHCYQSVGRVVEHRLDETWQRRILAVYAFPGVTA